jgi:hypothetical protein
MAKINVDPAVFKTGERGVAKTICSDADGVTSEIRLLSSRALLIQQY